MTLGQPVRDAADREAFRLWFNEMPVVRSLSLRCVSLDEGGAVGEMEIRDDMRNPAGALNGGYLLAGLDVCAGAAVSSAGPPGAESTTSDLSTHFLAAALHSPVRIEAEVLRVGRRNVVPTARVHDAAGTLCAAVTGTWVLRP